MRQPSRARTLCAALAVTALAALSLAGPAAAKLTGNWARFAQCPYTNAEVRRCIYPVTESGEVVLGSKTVPIENPTVLQGGIGKVSEHFSHFFGATNGVTLEEVQQSVPGGLSGLVNCKKISNFIVRIACEVTLENGFTGLNSTLVLARPASEIRVSQANLSAEEGVALELPVKVRLENPFLGSECYVGSSTSPIWWKLTTGTTSPPEPNKPITGAGGVGEILEEGEIAVTRGAKLVDNAWSAPGATGCGGFGVELLLDPIINAAAGLPATAGHNTAILGNTISIGSAGGVLKKQRRKPLKVKQVGLAAGAGFTPGARCRRSARLEAMGAVASVYS